MRAQPNVTQLSFFFHWYPREDKLISIAPHSPLREDEDAAVSLRCQGPSRRRPKGCSSNRRAPQCTSTWPTPPRTPHSACSGCTRRACGGDRRGRCPRCCPTRRSGQPKAPRWRSARWMSQTTSRRLCRALPPRFSHGRKARRRP